MKTNILLFIVGIALVSGGANAACSRANLTRCLDSACATNISSNPAARCQYCGTSSAGEPVATGMKTVAAGASAKYNISDKKLKSAPTDPGARYAWATKECIAIVNECTPDDVSDVYDELIEQSCRAAGISAQMATLQESARKTKSASACKAEIKACIVGTNRCTSDYSACADDPDLDKFMSACMVEATGCDEYLSEIRAEIVSARDNIAQNAAATIASVVASYQNTRASRIENIRTSCNDGSIRAACVEAVCERSMRNKCDAAHPSETSMATQLCKFYDVACATIK